VEEYILQEVQHQITMFTCTLWLTVLLVLAGLFPFNWDSSHVIFIIIWNTL